LRLRKTRKHRGIISPETCCPMPYHIVITSSIFLRMFSEASKVAGIQGFQSEVKFIPPYFLCFLTIIATAESNNINYQLILVKKTTPVKT